MLILSPLAFFSVWNFEFVCALHMSAGLHMLLLHIFVVSSFSIPLGFCRIEEMARANCGRYCSEVSPSAQILALWSPFLRFSHTCQNKYICQEFMRSHKAWLQPDWTVGELVLLIDTSSGYPSFLPHFRVLLSKRLDYCKCCWLVSYPQQIHISFWFCHGRNFQLKDSDLWKSLRLNLEWSRYVLRATPK